MRIESLPTISVSHLIKPDALNHHGTLFAGRMAEWVVETGFLGAVRALSVQPSEVVCVRMHGLTFTHPARNGHVIDMRAKAVHLGRSSVTMYVEVYRSDEPAKLLLDAFLTFVHVNEDGKSSPHGVSVERPVEGEALALWERAERLKTN